MFQLNEVGSQTTGSLEESERRGSRLMDGWMGRWVNGWTEGWTDGWTDKWMD